MATNAFISWVDSIMAFTPESRRELQLKLASIYHSTIYMPVDKAVIEHVSSDIAKDAGVSINEVQSLFKSVHEIDVLADPDSILRICCAPDPDYTWSKSGKIKEGLRGPVYRSLAYDGAISLRRLKEKLRTPGSEGFDWSREAAWHAVAATGGAKAWSVLNSALMCDYVCFDEASSYAATNLVSPRISRIAPSASRKIELAIPSAEKMSWENVFELRRNKNLDSFRQWIENRDDWDGREIVEGVWDAFSSIKPNVKGTIFKGIASNIPLPIPVNPASMYFAAKDAQQALKFKRDHSAMVFFHDLRQVTQRPR